MEGKEKQLSVIGICRDLNLNNIKQSDIDVLFETMCWKTTNEVHVFSFVAFMFLMEVSPLPVCYIGNYPEATVRVINTVKYYQSEFSLIDLLYLEYGSNEPTSKKSYVELMVNYTLCFINLWQKRINQNFKIEHNLFVPENFIIKSEAMDKLK